MGARSRGLVRWKTKQFGRGVFVYVTQDAAEVLFTSRSGFLYKGAHLPFVSSCGADQKQEIADAIWGCRNMKKKDRAKTPGAGMHASPDLLKGHFPKLAEWLTAAVYEDGTSREAPTFTLWASGGQWKATLKDRAEGLVMWLSAEKLLELIGMAESFCQEEEGPWRVDDYSPNHGKRKKGLG